MLGAKGQQALAATVKVRHPDIADGYHVYFAPTRPMNA
jgi:hypothetical protein